MFFRKKYINKIKKYLPNKENILFLIGARQVWKTTLLRMLIEKWIIDGDKTFWIDGDKIDIFSYKDLMVYLKTKVDLKNLEYLIIDEVHFIKNVGLILKNLIDDVRKGELNFKIICSGSGWVNIFKWLTDSLIGRYDIVYVWWFDFIEFVQYKGLNLEQFELSELNDFLINQIKSYFFEYLKFGSYPAVITASGEREKKIKLTSIVEDYFYKDVRNLLNKVDFLNFKKVLKVLAERVGSIFSVSNFISEVWLTKYYFEKIKSVLENTFFVRFIPSFVWWKDKLELKKSNKVYFYDIGIWRYFLGLDEWVWDFKWKAVESFVFFQIVSNMELYEDLYFWQRKNETEIDFVILDKIDKILKLIKVKSGKKDNIPRSIFSFLRFYWDFVNDIVITYDGGYKERKIENKIVRFVWYGFVRVS